MIKKTYFLFILGCQMNTSDAERLSAALRKLGYKQAFDEKKADLIIAVACSVRQMAVNKILGHGHLWQALKKKNPNLKIFVTGCVLPEDRPNFLKVFDRYFDIKKLDDLRTIMNDNRSRASTLSMSDFDGACGYLKTSPHYNSKSQAFVPIMTGCNNFCTYCAVPLTRGREVSRPAEDILREVRGLIKRGYKEITLLGQNVNNYGEAWTLLKKSKLKVTQNVTIVTKCVDSSDQGGWLGFARLLETIAKIPGDFWLRFLTSNPWNFNEEIINVMMKYLEKIAPYIHLPIQSGSNAVLKKMNRRHTIQDYKRKITLLRKQIPNIAISTDIIVGFCDETRQQFEETAKLMRWADFDMAFLAKYSPRRGTVAAKMWKDDVAPAEKTRRFNVLNKILAESALKNNKKYLDRKARVLVESYDKQTGRLSGRTDTFKLTHFVGPRKLVGQFVDVIIKRVTPWYLEGEL